MTVNLFNENLYLSNYPDVRAAVEAGVFSSGRQHFDRFGLNEGRVEISRFYDETYYLANQADVAAAVDRGAFVSGLAHYLQFGQAEGRPASPLFDETWYRRRYRDIAQAVSAGAFKSGLEHYILLGEAEGRSGTPFNEFAYKDDYPDVAEAIAAGTVVSGLAHYLDFGRTEGREALFSGTSGNDTVTAFGPIPTLVGVDVLPGECVVGGTPVGGECLQFVSEGVDERDVLVGGEGVDRFVLGSLLVTRVGVVERNFYVGNGDLDRADILNFEVGRDRLVLPSRESDYLFEADGDRIAISYKGNSFQAIEPPDLMAAIEGVPSVEALKTRIDFQGSGDL
ncbi:hypothetical protein [Oxynema aestuarii]|uniref:Uncharacterized protein n=1 Tax=Oxynema aestuarii AP17 TaxID=2064643 RepID=A0A6H1U390_9CYAN|nr:hypothetical protein [Oxynema aestuarii]QIZ73304.1 hypothetical protein HCG48_24120 [Oxynema aestuarii AP17]